MVEAGIGAPLVGGRAGRHEGQRLRVVAPDVVGALDRAVGSLAAPQKLADPAQDRFDGVTGWGRGPSSAAASAGASSVEGRSG